MENVRGITSKKHPKGGTYLDSFYRKKLSLSMKLKPPLLDKIKYMRYEKDLLTLSH